MANLEEPPEKAKSKKVFLNALDSFQGKNIGKFLSRCVVGTSLDPGDEEEDTKSFSSNPAQKIKDGGYYEIVGTAKDREKPKPDFAKEIIQYDNRDQFYDYLVECDIIIYDIIEDPDEIAEAVWVITELNADIEKLEKPKLFILISTCMTWAKSKPLDPESPETLFTEDDYRRRKPHMNFREHILAEKTVFRLGKTNKSKLLTYVVCSGLTYGAEENTFHYLFKSAWHNAPQLPCFGDGQNVLPTIHIKDLAAVIQNIADTRPKVRYLIAKDNSQNTLEDIVKAISNNLGSKKIKYILEDEAFIEAELLQDHLDMLLVNLKMKAVYVKESMHISWISEAGLVENIVMMIKEYKEARCLQPLRAVILGPPASGKSLLSKELCDFYKLHHITIKQVIDEELEDLKLRVEQLDEEPESEGAAAAANETREFLNAINNSIEAGNGRMEDKYVIAFLRNKLKSMPCQNQGFILDGYPKTIAQARELFASEDHEADPTDPASAFDKNTMPEYVISLDANDGFLRQRIMSLPEAKVVNTHNTEKGLLRRLKEYWTANTEDDTVLCYFDELEFHPERVDVTKDNSESMRDTLEKIKKIFGSPRNYGPTAEELMEIKRMEEEGRMMGEAEERALMEKQEAEEQQERKKRQEDWSQRLNEVKRQEFELLEAQSIPLRHYLMKHVMPTLTQALIDCCKVRPDDPIDFLAEYLFQHNPQVD